MKIILFLIMFSLAFQGLASQSFCDIIVDVDTSSTMDSDQHDCCDDDSNVKDQCQCSVAAVFVLPESYFLNLRDAINATPSSYFPKLYSIPAPNIFHPPRNS